MFRETRCLFAWGVWSLQIFIGFVSISSFPLIGLSAGPKIDVGCATGVLAAELADPFDELFGAASRASEAKSVKEVMELLPQQLRERFTFTYRSRSFEIKNPHGVIPPASEEFPRLIMSNNDGTLLGAVSMHKDQTDFAIELIRFDSGQGRFMPLVIEVSGSKVNLIRDPIRHYASTNPERVCSRCHGYAENFRPLWDNYPIWPGFIGSFEKTISQVEFAVINRFLAMREEQHPVLSTLRVANPSEIGRKMAKNTSGIEIDLQVLNATRIFRSLRANPKYDQLSIPLFLAIASPKSFADRIASQKELLNLWQKIQIQRLAEVDQNMARMRGNIPERRVYKPGDALGGVPALNASVVDTHKLSRIEFVMRKFGLSMNEWALTKQKRGIVWHSGANLMDSFLLRLLVEDLAKDYPTISKGADLITDNFSSYLAERHPFYSDEAFIDELAEIYRQPTGLELKPTR